MPSWRLADSLEMLRSQVNALAPGRSKNSDGTIGDTKHSKRKSDHNPNKDGVVLGMDLTHDPKHGFDSYSFAKKLVAERDKRLDYVISNGQIASRDHGFVWRKYSGSNRHDHHVHVSVMKTAQLYDDPAPWTVKVQGNDTDDHDPNRHTTIRRGNMGEDVKLLQRFLGIEVDGFFGSKTERAVKEWQQKNRLAADGIVGLLTWEAMEKSL